MTGAGLSGRSLPDRIRAGCREQVREPGAAIRIKAEAMEKHGVDIECCRETYLKSGERLFALVDTKPTHLRIEPWDDAKQRISQP